MLIGLWKKLAHHCAIVGVQPIFTENPMMCFLLVLHLIDYKILWHFRFTRLPKYHLAAWMLQWFFHEFQEKCTRHQINSLCIIQHWILVLQDLKSFREWSEHRRNDFKASFEDSIDGFKYLLFVIYSIWAANGAINT